MSSSRENESLWVNKADLVVIGDRAVIKNVSRIFNDEFVAVEKTRPSVSEEGAVGTTVNGSDYVINVRGDNTVIQNITQTIFKVSSGVRSKAFLVSSSDENQNIETIVRKPPELRLTSYPQNPVISCTNNNLVFPDRNLDHKYVLTLLRNSSDVLDVDFSDPQSMNNWKMDVSVTRIDQEGNEFSGNSLGCVYTAFKRRDLRRVGRGRYGFWFRFQRKNAQYRLTFAVKYTASGKSRGRIEKRTEEVIDIFRISVLTDPNQEAGKPTMVNANSTQVPKIKLHETGVNHNDVITSLCSLRDQGKWEAFNQKTSQMMAKSLDNEATAVVLLEMSVSACYSKEFDHAKELIEETLKLAQSCKGASALVARAHYYLASIHRREKNYGDSEKCIHTAEQNLDYVESDLDRAMLLYEKGGSLMDFISISAKKPSEGLVQMIKKNFEQCIEISKSLEDKLYIKKHHFALLRIAMLMLDCRSKAGRLRTVPKEDIDSAEQCLQELSIIIKEAPQGLKLQYIMACSDLCFRRGDFPGALENAIEALELVKKLCFHAQTQLVMDRIEDYQALTVDQEDYQDSFSDAENSNGGDVSSSC